MGYQNWGNDVPLGVMSMDTTYSLDELHSIHARNHRSHRLVDIFFKDIVGVSSLASLDIGYSDCDYHQDLNFELNLDGKKFALITNMGTGEHVFNQFQFFKSVHDHTLPGGLMYHEAPWIGWINHGFYSYHPTFFTDLAVANGYNICALHMGAFGSDYLVNLLNPTDLFLFCSALRRTPINNNTQKFTWQDRVINIQNSLLCVLYQKSGSGEHNEFVAPCQNDYADQIALPVRTYKEQE